jgi:hypothetical protein
MSSMEAVVETLQRMQSLLPTKAQQQALRLEDTDPLFSGLAVARRVLDHARVTVDNVAEILEDPQNTGSDWWKATGFQELQATIATAQIGRAGEERAAQQRAIANSRFSAASPTFRYVYRELVTVSILLQKEQKAIDQIVASHEQEKATHDEQARNSQKAKWPGWLTKLLQPAPSSSTETPDTLGEVLSKINMFIANYQMQLSRLWLRLAQLAEVAPGSSASSTD